MRKISPYKHYIIALLVGLATVLLFSPGEYLTQQGILVLAVLLSTLYLWVTNHTDWVSMLMFAALIITGILPFTAVWHQSWGNQIIAMILICMVLNNILSKCGVIEKVARWFVTRKFVEGRPKMFIVMFAFSGFLLGIFMQATVLLIIFITIAETFLREMGYKKGDSFYTAVMLTLLWNSSLSAVSTPFSTSLPLIMMDAVYASHGVSITWGQWIAIGVPWSFMMFALGAFVICVLWKNLDTSKFENYNVEEAKQNSPPLSKEGRIASVVAILVVLAWIFPEIARPFSPETAAWVSGLGFAVPPIIGVAFLCMIRVKNKPIANYTEMTKNIPIGVLGFIGAVLVFGNALNHADAGIIAQLRHALEPFTSEMSPTIIVGIAIVGSLILTKFISNTVTMLLFVHITLPLVVGSDLSLPAVTILIGLAASLGALLPSSNVMAPVMFGPEHITFANTWKYNLIFLLLAYIPTLFILFPFANTILA